MMLYKDPYKVTDEDKSLMRMVENGFHPVGPILIDIYHLPNYKSIFNILIRNGLIGEKLANVLISDYNPNGNGVINLKKFIADLQSLGSRRIMKNSY